MSRLWLSLLLVAGPAAPLLAQQPDSPPGGPALRERIERRFSERIQEELDLSDEQAAKLKEVAKENGSRRRDMRRRERALYAAIDQQLGRRGKGRSGQRRAHDAGAARSPRRIRAEYPAGDGQAVVPYPGPAGQADDHARPPAPSGARDARRSASLPPPRPRRLDFRRLPQQERRDAPPAALDARLPRARGSRLRPDAGRLPRRGQRHGGERSGALRRPRRSARRRPPVPPPPISTSTLPAAGSTPPSGSPTRCAGARLPVYAFVNPRAFSAGALIALSAKAIYMRPGAVLGAATPVDGEGQGASEKMVSAMRAEFRVARRGARSRPAYRRGDGGRARRDPRRRSRRASCSRSPPARRCRWATPRRRWPTRPSCSTRSVSPGRTVVLGRAQLGRAGGAVPDQPARLPAAAFARHPRTGVRDQDRRLRPRAG